MAGWMAVALAGEPKTAVVPARPAPAALAAAGTYEPEDGIIDIEISEYAGYAGLLYANGGLEPNPDTIFAREYGFQVRLAVSEAEDWSPLNAGGIAAASTTVDVLAVYGSLLKVRVPLLLGFSRGTDGLVVDREIRKINDLAGKRIATCQFTEADFFLRYLASEASVPVRTLDRLDDPADPGAINLVFTEDAFGAGDLYAAELAAGTGRLAGCVTWDPKTSEVVEASEGEARLLVTNRNLLMVADILLVNAGFADARPEWVAGLVKGILQGNDAVRNDPSAAVAVLAKAFHWTAEDTETELSKVHLANWPENMAFFSGQMVNAGSFSHIYETARDIYGPEIARHAAPPRSFLSPSTLEAANRDGTFAGQNAEIRPMASASRDGGAETQELLAKDLYFYFNPNSAVLTQEREAENQAQLETILRWLQVSPGSRILLRGHADGSRLAEINEKEGAAKAREARIILKNLSQERCAALRERLLAVPRTEGARIETHAIGADEPTGRGPDADRRVEARWYTLE